MWVYSRYFRKTRNTPCRLCGVWVSVQNKIPKKKKSEKEYGKPKRHYHIKMNRDDKNILDFKDYISDKV